MLNELLDIVLDDLLRMSEGKEHATSLADLKDTQLQRQIKIEQTQIARTIGHQSSNGSKCELVIWCLHAKRASSVSCDFHHHVYADREIDLVRLMLQRQPAMVHT